MIFAFSSAVLSPDALLRVLAMFRRGRRVGGDTRFVTMGAAAAVAERRDKPKPGASSSPY